ncbi:hypothetical protein ACN27J_27365 [Solwaraspora sp. WMMB762]|uniref:hypothetical protein n=1 Tax=Solwaraspora sp. WMMB762 TaxID=3404120 RepID=UPI003B95C575
MNQEDVVTTVVDSAEPLAPAPEAGFTRKLVLLAVGGALVGLAITAALGGDAPFTVQSWGRTLLLLAAVALAAGVGALAHRTIAGPGQVNQLAAARLEAVSTELDTALRHAEASRAVTDSPTARAQADALSDKLDALNTEFESLMRNVTSVESKLASANRTAWATFFLGALVGLVTQVTLG